MSNPTSPWDDPRTHILEMGSGSCTSDFACIDVDTITESDGVVITEGYCYDKQGNPVLRTSIQGGLPTRGTTTLTGLASDMQDILVVHKGIREGGSSCLQDARIAVYCDPKDLGNPSGLVGWYGLEQFDPGQMSLPRTTNRDGNRAVGDVRISSSASYSGIVPIYRVDSFNVAKYQFKVAGQTPVALVQCGTGVCRSGVDCLGKVIQKRNDCDRWLLFATDGTDTFVYESTDGGISYDIDNPLSITGLGKAIWADCNNLVTDRGPLELCGDVYRQQKLPRTFTPAGTGGAGEYTSVEAAAPGALLYHNGPTDKNGVFLYNTNQSAWVDSYPANGVLSEQSVIASDGGNNVITGGAADGTVKGAMYNIWNGASWISGRYAPAETTVWETVSDQILSVDITEGVFTMVVTNGATTRTVYSEDGTNWISSDERSGAVANSQVMRPTSFITWRIADCKIWANFYGVCDCKWTQQEETDQCFAVFGVCFTNPFKLASVYV